MTFPLDDYTPHGYLDLPTHCRNLHPLGVLRSHDVGFRWHFPAHGGMYGGRRETYRAGFRVALDDALTIADFEAISAPYHSKDFVSFDLTHRDTRLTVDWSAVGENALRATIRRDPTTPPARVSLHIEYTRLVSANGEWGESGLVGRWADDCLILQSFEDGDAFVLWTSHPAIAFAITPDAIASTWLAQPSRSPWPIDPVTILGSRGDTVSLFAALQLSDVIPDEIEVIFARGKTVPEAARHLEYARRHASSDLAAKHAADTAFWATAPRLSGDWPAHWRRGLVYDLETIRMMVKPPTGSYTHPWDAMQIQAPRVVLAEAAIDALLLAYADPALAQTLMFGTFADAAIPNVPCSREDGSFNMVAADGAICGTAPQWGYPWLVLDWLFAIRPDRVWLAKLYPHLTAYLDWWWRHRRDPDGWLVHACSWESGQDESPRFGEQPLGGGHPVRHLRPVDLHAAYTHAALVMNRFAMILDLSHDVAKWNAVAGDLRQRTSALWNGQRYADVDARTGHFTPIDDPMLLAPLFLDLADADRTMASAPGVTASEADDLVWPMFAWTAIGAALNIGETDHAADHAAAICDRAYRFWDARTVADGGTLPGIASEYWPLSDRRGGEGYGWGAFTTHLVLHVLIGLTPTVGALQIRPSLPTAWRTAGRHYDLTIQLRDQPMELSIQPLGPDRVRITLGQSTVEHDWGAVVTIPWPTLVSAGP